MDNNGFNVIGSKIDYLRELKQLLHEEMLTDAGVQIVYGRISKVCDSIEVDLGITPPPKNR